MRRPDIILTNITTMILIQNLVDFIISKEMIRISDPENIAGYTKICR